MLTPTPRRRRLSLPTVILAVIATVLALLTLLGLANFPALPASINLALSELSNLLIQLVTVVGAIAVIIGVLNLLAVHIGKLTRRERGGPYSLVTILAAIVVVAVHLADRAGLFQAVEPGRATGDMSPVISLALMDTVQVAIESALAGLLVFFLVYAAYRLMRWRVTGWNILFVLTLLIVLIGYIPMSNLEFLSGLRDWVLRVPVSAGTRGLLIGVAIGTVTVGVRFLLGQDRSFRE